jgi:phosphoribosylanthranilate isomerase
VFVKICGVTRREDAQAAVRAGASAIGFIFWPGSPRFIDPFKAGEIARTLPPFVSVVGVFVNQDAGYINGVASAARLTAVQLHGDELPPVAAQVNRPVVKAVPVAAPQDDLWPDSITLLVDAQDPLRRGGTGRTIDWQAAAPLAARRRLLLAGGLTPDNVREAIATVRPFGIDVSSGVESSPGIKDHGRLRALLEAVRAS